MSDITVISHHRTFVRNYSREELLGEINNIMRDSSYKDFMFVAVSDEGDRAIRIGSEDRSLRVGDLLFLNQVMKDDIMRF